MSLFSRRYITLLMRKAGYKLAATQVKNVPEQDLPRVARKWEDFLSQYRGTTTLH
jgi:hypothetical protein